MSRRIFISYANEAMSWSLKRIGRQAQRLGIFDEVILYTPQDLPEEVRAHPLMEYSRGAGYWLWKPYIIQHTLDTHAAGDVVVYADAGCTLRKSFAWQVLFGLMNKYDSIAFQYTEEEYPEWAKWGSTSAKMKVWTKKATLTFLDSYLGSQEYREENLVLGGFLLLKGKSNTFLHEWKRLVSSHPELVMDPAPEELSEQHPEYVGHRHEQCFLCPLSLRDAHTLVLPEALERYTPDAPVWASRVRATSFWDGVRRLLPIYLRAWMGNDFVNKIKSTITRHR